MEKIYALLWLADVVESIGFVGVLCVIGLVVAIVIGLLSAAVSELDGDDAMRAVRVCKWWIAALALPAMIAVVTPSGKTVRIMAAAVAGDVAVATPLGAKAMQAIDAVLDDLIATKKAKK